MQGGRRDLSAKNEIRESIRALFPDRECFKLVRPLNNEKDLQSLDQIAVIFYSSLQVCFGISVFIYLFLFFHISIFFPFFPFFQGLISFFHFFRLRSFFLFDN